MSIAPGIEEAFEPMAPWGIPALNTLILLSSGATVTWAHWGLKKHNRRQLNIGMFLTIALGCLFLLVMTFAWQHYKAIEYGYKIESMKVQRERSTTV
jgi:cytochrome c oxidase subunit 3